MDPPLAKPKIVLIGPTTKIGQLKPHHRQSPIWSPSDNNWSVYPKPVPHSLVIETPQSSWRCVTRLKEFKKTFSAVRQNFRNEANIGHKRQRPKSYSVVSIVGAGFSFVKAALIPAKLRHLIWQFGDSCKTIEGGCDTWMRLLRLFCESYSAATLIRRFDPRCFRTNPQ